MQDGCSVAERRTEERPKSGRSGRTATEQQPNEQPTGGHFFRRFSRQEGAVSRKIYPPAPDTPVRKRLVPFEAIGYLRGRLHARQAARRTGAA